MDYEFEIAYTVLDYPIFDLDYIQMRMLIHLCQEDKIHFWRN